MIQFIKIICKTIIREVARILLSKHKISKDYEYLILGDDGSKNSKNFHYYVGYYDIDPLNDVSQKILCHRVSKKFTKSIMPKTGDIGLLSIQNGVFEKLEVSKALNWQLGCRVQWLDKNHIIYNDIQKGEQISRKLNINTKQVVKEYNRPFWAISPNKKIGASLNFSRIREKRPGYGYDGRSKDKNLEKLTLFNLDTGRCIYVTSLSDILKEINFETGNKDVYLNHIAWSPCSKKLLSVFHFAETGKDARRVFPILLDLDQNNWSIIDTSGLFSHHVWIDSAKLLAYKNINEKRRFCVWSNTSGWRSLSGSMPNTDGHPSLLFDNDAVIVDTYPNFLGKMKLYLGCSQPGKKYSTIGWVLNPSEYNGPLRCDLHPRVTKNDSQIVCDIPTREGRRILMLRRNN